MSRSLEGKVALITGGSSGIGLATAKRFVREGATVYITGRRRDVLDAAVRAIGAGAIGVQGDVANLAELDRLYEQIAREKGRLDILFANAGLNTLFAKLGEITEDMVDAQLGVNIKGVLFSVQKALPLMKNGGSIVLNASAVSIKGFEAISVYAATKAAMRSFARTWATDLKGRGIRVNALSPGVVVTPAYQGHGEQGIKAIKEQMNPQIPLGRTGTEDEIAAAVLFLASDESSYITGSDLFVDGGLAQV